MDLQGTKNFVVKTEDFLKSILEERYGKGQGQVRAQKDDLSSDAILKLATSTFEWLDAYQEINDQINQKKELIIKSKKVREERKIEQEKQQQGKEKKSG